MADPIARLRHVEMPELVALKYMSSTLTIPLRVPGCEICTG